MLPYLPIYITGLLATFAYLAVSLRSFATNPQTYRNHLKEVWGEYLITSFLWCIILPLCFGHEGLKRLGRLLGIYGGF